MDLWEQPGGRPMPRRELQLQGPRPSPLNVRKDSHKIKKTPPPPPPPSSETAAPLPQRRSPVIIYTVSPKVIHTEPSEFMSLVQRLTGVSSSSAPAAEEDDSAAEKTSLGARIIGPSGEYEAEKVVSPKILSLLPPSSTASGSPSLFSPSEEMSPLNFMNELSPGLQGNRAFLEGNFLNSPSNLLSTPTLTSPTTFWDLLNQFKE
ncbi:hypothetical protein HPP92_011922 [Vanilla planifolia]|uniref:VQ domain-containing protein n=1 Tax=Vanilla planifolia TaxID=51239 RepID=A0A835R2R0_VANPL|nr:hypothetical protein HPP92_011922 [Vanilla planifolia]